MCLDAISFQKQLDAMVTHVMTTDTPLEFKTPVHSDELTDLLEVCESVPPVVDYATDLVTIAWLKAKCLAHAV